MLAFKIKLVLSILAAVILIDVYSWQAVRTILINKYKKLMIPAKTLHFGITIVVVFVFGIINIFVSLEKNVFLRYYLAAAVFVFYLPKLVACIFLLIDDLQRFLRWIIKAAIHLAGGKKITKTKSANAISRARFLSQAGVVVSAAPFIVLNKGIFKGAYDYRLHRVKLYLKNLPLAFEGLKIVQLSDIHTGSLFDKDSVHKGIQMAMQEKPDMVMFTGDLVNNETSEAYSLMDHFAHVKAPMGVFSTFGNHDYGDYISWESPQAKAKNLEDLVKVHKDIGWHLMRNEHLQLEKGGQHINLIGVENWGDRGRFQKFGDLEVATKGMLDGAVNLLMSHDPSHFDSIVSTQYPHINATFSGHTHGFQFGIENSFIKWSPSQYIYPHWAGLYKVGEQQLYVNRGYGFLGYPGRVGILPEITLFELTRV